jgi:protein-tyrosine phosphatase
VTSPPTPQAPAFAPDRHLRLPGTRNLRDVGGYPAGAGRRTRWRTLFRTDALDSLPDASKVRVRELGVRCIIDLRWPHELAASPSVFAADSHVLYHSIPLLDDDPSPVIGLAATYRHMLDERPAQLAEVARTLLEPAGLPAVIGCAAGKDRTGVTIALLLSAIGVPADVVIADYILTGPAFATAEPDPHLNDWRAEPHELECPPEHMQAMLEHLERRHGGAAALLRRNGLGQADLDRLADLLTEPVAS